jgi:hypothetical protein
MCAVLCEEQPGCGEHAEKKGLGGGEKSKKLVWQFGTGNRKCRWHARVYPEQENGAILPLLPLKVWAPCKERWV